MPCFGSFGVNRHADTVNLELAEEDRPEQVHKVNERLKGRLFGKSEWKGRRKEYA